MPVRHGKDTVFKLDNAAGTPIDISAFANTTGLQRAIDQHETTRFGNQDKTFITGLKGARIPISGPWDPTIDAHLDGIFGVGEKTFEYGPEGSTTGRIRYTGECLLISYEQASPVGGEATFTGELLISGAVTRNTWP